MLLDAYLKIEQGELSRSEAVKGVSNMLRERAVKNGMVIDDSFRSIDEINKQLSRMEYLMTDGKHGLTDPPQIFCYVVDLYKNNYYEFEKLLIKDNEFDLDKIAEQNTRQQFCSWLEINAPYADCKQVCSHLQIIEEYCFDIDLISNPIFETRDAVVIKNVVDAVTNNQFFRHRNSNQIHDIIKAVNYYSNFVNNLSVIESNESDSNVSPQDVPAYPQSMSDDDSFREEQLTFSSFTQPDELDDDGYEQESYGETLPLDEFDVALLIDTYIKVDRNELPKSKAVILASRKLRDIYISEGIEIEYGALNEISVFGYLNRIEYFMTYGRKGYPNFTPIFEDIVRLYREDRYEFNDLLNKYGRINLENLLDIEELTPDRIKDIAEELFIFGVFNCVGEFTNRLSNGGYNKGLEYIEMAAKAGYEKAEEIVNIGDYNDQELYISLEGVKLGCFRVKDDLDSLYSHEIVEINERITDPEKRNEFETALENFKQFDHSFSPSLRTEIRELMKSYFDIIDEYISSDEDFDDDFDMRDSYESALKNYKPVPYISPTSEYSNIVTANESVSSKIIYENEVVSNIDDIQESDIQIDSVNKSEIEKLFKLGLRCYVGDIDGYPNFITGKKYLKKVLYTGHRKAEEIFLYNSDLKNLYIHLEAAKIGSRKSYEYLYNLKSGYLKQKIIDYKKIQEFESALKNFKEIPYVQPTLKTEDIVTANEPVNSKIIDNDEAVSNINEKQEYDIQIPPLNKSEADEVTAHESKPQKILFDEYETVILLEGYLKFKRGELTRSEAVKEVSKQLRERTIRKGIKIDDSFRSEIGISGRMNKLEYAFTESNNDINNLPQIFKYIVDIYKNDNDLYNKLLNEAKDVNYMPQSERRYKIKEDAEFLDFESKFTDNTHISVSSHRNNRLQFCRWLKNKAPKVNSNTVCNHIQSIERYCLSINIINNPIFETTDPNIIKYLVVALNKNKKMRNQYKKHISNIIMSLNYYHDFIKNQYDIESKEINKDINNRHDIKLFENKYNEGTDNLNISESNKQNEYTSDKLNEELSDFLKSKKNGVTYQEILNHFLVLDYSKYEIKSALSECKPVYVVKKYYHKDNIWDYDDNAYGEMAKTLLSVLNNQFKENGGYISAKQLYIDSQCRLDEYFYCHYYNKELTSRLGIYDIARYLFEKESYEGNSFIFYENKHIWREEPDYPKDYSGLMIKFARENNNTFTREQIREYFDEITDSNTNSLFSNIIARNNNKSLFVQYDENSFVLKDALEINDYFKSEVENQIQRLLDEVNNDYVTFGELDKYEDFYKLLPDISANIKWTPYLLSDILRIFDIEGGTPYKTVYAGKNNDMKTIPAAILKKNSQFKNFSDLVFNEIASTDSFSLPKTMTSSEFREFLLKKGFIHGNEKISNVHKTVEEDPHFLWTNNNREVIINK